MKIIFCRKWSPDYEARHAVPSVVTFVVYSMKRESENNFFVESESENAVKMATHCYNVVS